MRFEISNIKFQIFTGFSLLLHPIRAAAGDGLFAMNENIVITRVKIELLKVWIRRALEAAIWLICLGLLAASAVVAACGALAWLVSGNETLLATGLGGGLLLGLAGVWQLLHRLDRAAKALRPDARENQE